MTGFRVAVIGGGVSGLTAAHELAERGFQVWVFEGEHDALRRANVGYKTRAADDPAFAGVAASARQPLVGGLAATQWYRIPKAWSPVEEVRPPFQRLDLAASVNLAKPEDWWSPVFEQRDRECLASEAGDARVRFQLDDGELTAFAEMRIGRLAKRLSDLLLTEEADATLEIQCVAFVGESVGLAAQRGHQILLELLTACHRRGLEASLPEDGSRTSVCVRVPRATNGRVFHVNIVQAFVNPIVITEAKERHVKLRLSSASGATISEVSWESPRPKDVEHELSQWEGRWPMLSFTEGSVQISKFAEWRIAEIAKRLKELLARITTDEYLVIGGVIAAREVKDKIADPFTDVDDLALRRAEAVAEVLKRVCGDLVWESAGLVAFDLKARDKSVCIHVRVAGLGALHATEAARPASTQQYVEIRLLDRLLPGEHGYRFFPSFYHHTFDTMKRIPQLVPGKRDTFMTGFALDISRDFPTRGFRENWEPTALTVFDNLRSVDLHALDSGAEGAIRPMERFNTRSLRGLLKMLDTFQEHADVPLRDIILGQLKVVRYATSCAARRDSYEAQTWSQFTESHLGGLEYQRLLDHWPQALVGLQASRADARTTGTVLLQLLLDQVRSSGYRDGTLNAPTSESWLDPWKRYLEHERGVEFVCAKIDEFRFIKDQRGIELINVAGAGCDGETVIDRNAIAADYDYVVIATSVDVTAKLGRALRVRLEIDRPDLLADFEKSPFHGVKALLPSGFKYQDAGGSEDPFEHFSGIQFFLNTDYAPLRGHVYYPNSPWRLSSVSQSQFRLDRPDQLDGYTGVISVVIGAFDERGHNNKTAWGSTADEIAKEVWDQITKSLQRSSDGAPPPPQFYAIDKNLLFEGPGGTLSSNRTPFLVNSADRVGAFPERPGAYEVHMRHFVFAGTYLQTRTRLVTMEAANESARHAVNAIIRHGRAASGPNTGQLCPIFDPEEREPDELQLLHRIDAELLARGLPHWMDILVVEPQALALLDRGDGARGQSVMGALISVLEEAGGLGGELLRLIRLQIVGGV